MLTGFTTTVQCWIRTGKGPMHINQPSIRAGEAREAILMAMKDDPSGPWRANRNLTRQQVARVLLAALPDDPEQPLEHMHATNVLRLVLKRKSVRALVAPC